MRLPNKLRVLLRRSNEPVTVIQETSPPRRWILGDYPVGPVLRCSSQSTTEHAQR